MWRTLALVSIGVVLPVLAQAQTLVIDTYTRGQGHADVALSVAYEQYDTIYIGSERSPTPEGALGDVTVTTLNLFASIGLLDDLDLIVALPVIYSDGSGNAPSPPTDQSGIQDISVYGKWTPFQLNTFLGTSSRLSVATALGVRAPVNDYDLDQPLSIGNGAFALDPRVVLQHDWDFGLNVAVQSGATYRSGDVPSSVPFFARVGYSVWRLYLQAWLDQQWSLSGTDIGPDVAFTTNQVNFTRIGGGVYAEVVDAWLGISANVGTTLSGRNTAETTFFSGGVVLRI